MKMQNGYAYPIISPESFSKSHDRYLTITSQKYAPPQSIPAAPSSSSGIEDILEQDSQALLDQVVTTAFSIVYRLRIYNDINTKLEYNWAKTKSQLLQLYDWIPGTNMNVERRRSMLQKRDPWHRQTKIGRENKLLERPHTANQLLRQPVPQA